MPKRKAISKLSGLVSSDVEDDELIESQFDTRQQDVDTAPPPAKRQRGRPPASAAVTATTANAASSTKRAPRKRKSVVVGPKKAAAKGSTKRKSTEGDSIVEHDAVDQDEYNVEAAEGVSKDELDSPKDVRWSEPKHSSQDGEFVYTPAGSTTRPQSTTRGRGGRVARESTRGRKPTKAQRELTSRGEKVAASSAEYEEPGPPVDGEDSRVTNRYDSPPRPSSPSKRQINGLSPLKKPGTPGQQRKSVRIEEPPESEAALRRKVGDMTKKLETAETKYRTLREVGIVEANANMEKLRKQCEATTAASKELVASLKRELAQQASLAEESRALQKQLKERTTEASKLQSTVKEMTSSLTNARNEIKSLQSKLAASRNTSLVAEGTQAKGPGAAKGSSRGGAAGAADAALAVQIAQLKEDLYSDLTGLIIRDVKHQDGEQIYDCIQTGVNGTLHFKLSISSPSDKGTTTSLESAEFQYSPLLDANRDRQLIDILPEYLTVDITFSRQNAAKFYSRVADTLMKKRVE